VNQIFLFFAVIFSSFIFGFAYRFLLRKFSSNKIRRVTMNIDWTGRLIRGGLGVGLLILSIYWGFHLPTAFFAGFCFFEAIFSWCGLFAALGKTSCPIN